MTIKVGDKVGDATLYESTEFGEFCPVGPEKISVAEAVKGKKIVVFGLPGAYTPTCSAKHVPGYKAKAAEIKAKGVDEIWCVSVNDGFVMAAWGRDEDALGDIRFLGDGSAEFAKSIGMDVDLTGFGMGVRMGRFSMLLDDGEVKSINIEGPGKFEVSDADTMLDQL